jgi:hypothetical protein
MGDWEVAELKLRRRPCFRIQSRPQQTSTRGENEPTTNSWHWHGRCCAEPQLHGHRSRLRLISCPLLGSVAGDLVDALAVENGCGLLGARRQRGPVGAAGSEVLRDEDQLIQPTFAEHRHPS